MTDTFHRIAESVAKSELLAAGFVLDGEADFLRDPDDTRLERFAARSRG